MEKSTVAYTVDRKGYHLLLKRFLLMFAHNAVKNILRKKKWMLYRICSRCLKKTG